MPGIHGGRRMLRCVCPLPRVRVGRQEALLTPLLSFGKYQMSRTGREERRVATTAVEITDATFDAEVLQSDKPVLVDFWAPWCAPCRTVGAVLDQLSGERDDVKIVKINIDDNQDQAIKNSVLLLPTVMLFKDGKAVGKLQGGAPPTAIARLLDEHLPAAEPALTGEAVAS